MKRWYAYLGWVFYLTLLPLQLLAQSSVIGNELQQVMSQAGDEDLIRVLIFFKGELTFSPAEELQMQNMSGSDRGIFFANALKQFNQTQKASVLQIIRNAEDQEKAKLIVDLWGCYGIGCVATKEIIEQVALDDDVKRIKYDPIAKPGEAPKDLHAITPGNKIISLISPATMPDVTWNLEKIKAPEVWDMGFTGQNVLVAVLDAGFDATNPFHDDLRSQLWDGKGTNGSQLSYNGQSLIHHGWDTVGGVEGDNDPRVSGSGGFHGTNVAGIVAGNGSNGTKTGAAPDVTLMLIRCVGGGETSMLAGFQWFLDMKAQNPTNFNPPDVINFSAGRIFDDNPSYEAWREMFNSLLGLNDKMVITAATGNDGNALAPNGYDINSPANIPPAWLHPDQPAPSPTSAPHTSCVLAVAATSSTDVITSYSNTGDAGWENITSCYPLQQPIDSKFWDYLVCTSTNPNPLIKPDVTAPSHTSLSSTGGELWTTRPGNMYLEFSGTSAASPHVAGLAALIYSANSNLNSTDVSRIIQLTAVDLGSSGKDKVYGAGRIDAYQAVLMALTYDNKSIDNDATAANNGRRLVRDGSGNYHLVFASGGEIFYRKNVSGSWQTPQRMSSGNGDNKFPSITEKSGKVYITWQRKTGSSSYDIHFAASTDGGSSWSKNYTLTNTNNLSADPLPVIQASVTSADHLMIVYRDGKTPKGLTSFYTSSSNPSTSNWSQDHIPGTDANSLNPSLTATGFSGSSPAFALSWQSNGGTVYYQYYLPPLFTWGSKINLSTIVPGSGTHQTPSISNVPGGNPLHVAWHRTNDVIIHRRATGYSGFMNEYFMTFFEFQSKPSITGFSLNKAALLFDFGPGNVFIQHFNNGSWGGIINKGLGTNPSVSIGQSQAKYVWASGSALPFTVNLSSEVLSKAGETIEPVYSRSISWLDSSGAYLQMRVLGFNVVLADGSREPLDFKPVALDQLDSLDFTPKNIWQWQTTLPKQIPANAESLIVEFTVDGRNIEKVLKRGAGIFASRFNIEDEQNIPLASVTGAQFATTGDIAAQTHRIGVPIAQLPTVNFPVKLKMDLGGLAARKTTFASLGHIFDFRKPSNSAIKSTTQPETTPVAGQVKDFRIASAFPNPFNPSTTVRYNIPQTAFVEITVYSLLGEKVRTLVNSTTSEGIYETTWDGRNDLGNAAGSGIYLLQLTARAGQHLFSDTYKIILLK